MAAPTSAERDVVAVYQRAERALLRTVGDQAGKTARNPGRGVTPGVTAVRAATAAVVRQLDTVTPGLLADRLTAATEQGARQAADILRELPDRPTGGPRRDSDPGVNLGALERLAVALLERTDEVHRAILTVTPGRYRDAVVEALPDALAGVDTRRDATQRAVWRLAREGITTFEDRSGRTWRASTYMEMAVRTAMARATEDAKLDRLRAAGHDLVIVQGGPDRCERCRPWNGLVLSITGATVSAADVAVAGTVADARLAGWGHPQCRCTLDLYQPGITRPVPAVEREDNGQYAARQRQRAIERSIRAAKEAEAAAIDTAGTRDARAAVRAAQARMRAHLADNPELLRRAYREQIGAGNIADAATAARFDTEHAAGLPEAPRAPLLSQLRVGELRDRMRAAAARGDERAADRYAGERVRRDVRLTTRRKQRIAARDARTG